MHWMNGCTGIQGGWGMMIGMFVFWGLLIFLGFYLMRNYLGGNGQKSNMDVLKERLVRGEISEEEFDRLKAKL